MTNYVVYLLHSEKDGNYYIGQTKNLDLRLKKHRNGEVKSTRNRRPLRHIGYKEFNTQKEARYFEYQLKHHSDKKKKFIEDCVRFSGPEVRTD
ncbi:MAG: GIY-YIG nuclease family protein [Deltaproteobacteria bacterium]|nr:GIY-YIG nuclease family protein [Deltaproteobacteria bacterium]